MKLFNNFASVKCALSNILSGRTRSGECIDFGSEHFGDDARGKCNEEIRIKIYSKVFSYL